MVVENGSSIADTVGVNDGLRRDRIGVLLHQSLVCDLTY